MGLSGRTSCSDALRRKSRIAGVTFDLLAVDWIFCTLGSNSEISSKVVSSGRLYASICVSL